MPERDTPRRCARLAWRLIPDLTLLVGPPPSWAGYLVSGMEEAPVLAPEELRTWLRTAAVVSGDPFHYMALRWRAMLPGQILRVEWYGPGTRPAVTLQDWGLAPWDRPLETFDLPPPP